jgi:excisionase family DNA binding protein
VAATKRAKVARPRAPGAPYSVEQAAQALNLAPRTVIKRIKEGKLRAYKDGRLVRVAESDLVEYMARLRGEGQADPASFLVRRHLRTPARKPGQG